MSTKDMLYGLIDGLNEEQQKGLLIMLMGFARVTEIDPDEIDLGIMAEAARENDGTTVSIEDLAKELGIDYGTL